MERTWLWWWCGRVWEGVDRGLFVGGAAVVVVVMIATYYYSIGCGVGLKAVAKLIVELL